MQIILSRHTPTEPPEPKLIPTRIPVYHVGGVRLEEWADAETIALASQIWELGFGRDYDEDTPAETLTKKAAYRIRALQTGLMALAGREADWRPPGELPRPPARLYDRLVDAGLARCDERGDLWWV